METPREGKDTLRCALETQRRKSLSAYTPATVTLDPEKAHSSLVLSEDRKRVRRADTRQRRPSTQERFDTQACVLGSERFTSGRHCWEVEVGDGPFWAVGVARECINREDRNSYNFHEKIWAVERWGDQFWALTDPLTPLPLSQVPSRIWVCLDCDRGQVAFIDAAYEAPIYTFPAGSVSAQSIRPWFRVGQGSQLSLCP
nr:butyrophilin subfamily 1 member A1-like [Pelodiscus sinensis]|eukprot:XP_014430727.1 butyrophilin subfamily 1 member A1-like [Pelodiscus sinensis]